MCFLVVTFAVPVVGCSQGGVIVSPSLVVVISFIHKLFLLNGTVIAPATIGFFLQWTVTSRCAMFHNRLMIMEAAIAIWEVGACGH
jgi:hypothetical protein